MTTIPLLTNQPGKKGTLLANLVCSLSGFILSLLTGIWYTPFLIDHLGATSFGLIPLATTATSYLGLLTIAFSHSLARFFTIAVEREDRRDANHIFNTALLGGAGLSVLVVLPAALFSLEFNTVIQVPQGSEQDALLLYVLATSAFMLSIIAAPFDIASFTRNRLDLRAIGEMLSNIVRVLAIVVLFSMITPRLWHVGVGLLLASFVRGLYSIYISRRLVPYVRVDLSDARWATFRKMYQTSTWVIVDQLGLILCGGVDLLFANVFLNAQAAGEYALVLQWSSLLRGLGTSITSVLAPSAISHFANNDFEALVKQTVTGMRLTALFIALPVGLLCGLSREILRLWVGVGFEPLVPLMRLSIAPLGLFLATTPLMYVLMAVNTVKVPSLWTVGFGAMNVFLLYLFVGPLQWGLYGIAMATLLTQTGKTLLFLPLYTSRQIGCPVGPLLRVPWSGAIAIPAIASISLITAQAHPVVTLTDLLGLVLFISTLYASVAYSLLLSGPDRQVIHSKITALLSRYQT